MVRGLDDAALDDRLGEEPDRPAAIAFGRLRAGERDQVGLLLAVEDRLDRRSLPLLACQHGGETLGDELLAHAGDHADVGVERLADALVRPPFAALALIGFEQDAGLEEGLGRRLTLRDEVVELLALLARQPDDEFLVGHGPAPLSVATDRARISVREKSQRLTLREASH